MNLPSIDLVSSNFTVVHMDHMSLWFSYSTMIAFRIGADMFVSENNWSKTTGKHLNAVESDKSKRIPYAEFLAKWNELTEGKPCPAPQGLFG